MTPVEFIAHSMRARKVQYPDSTFEELAAIAIGALSQVVNDKMMDAFNEAVWDRDRKPAYRNETMGDAFRRCLSAAILAAQKEGRTEARPETTKSNRKPHHQLANPRR